MWLGFLVPGGLPQRKPKIQSMSRGGSKKHHKKYRGIRPGTVKNSQKSRNCIIFCQRCPMKLRISIFRFPMAKWPTGQFPELRGPISQRPGPRSAFGCGGHRGAGNHGPMAKGIGGMEKSMGMARKYLYTYVYIYISHIYISHYIYICIPHLYTYIYIHT